MIEAEHVEPPLAGHCQTVQAGTTTSISDETGGKRYDRYEKMKEVADNVASKVGRRTKRSNSKFDYRC